METKPSCLNYLSYPASGGTVCLRKLLDRSADLFCSLDSQGLFIYVSAAAHALWGYGPGELTGLSYLNKVVEGDRTATVQTMEQIRQDKTETRFANRYYCRDGSIRSMNWTASWDEEDKVFYCLGSAVSEPKMEVENEWQDKEHLHRALQLSELGWWEWDLRTNSYKASDQLYRIYGLNRADYPSITVDIFFSLVRPNDLDSLQKSFANLQELTNLELKHRLLQPNGNILFLRQSIQAMRDTAGKVIGIHGITKDITEDQKARFLLEESRQKLTSILESIGDGFFAVDNDWRITYWNKKAEEFLQHNRKEVLGKHLWSDIFPDAVNLKFYAEYHRAMEQGCPVHFEEFYPALNIWVNVSIYPAAEGLSIFFRNISENKKHQEDQKIAAEKLEKANDNLQTVLESMSDGFYTVDRSWCIRYATDKVAAMLGINKNDYLGKNIWDSFPPAINTRFYSEYHRAFAENTFVSFEEYLAPFNMWFEVNAYPYNEVLAVYVKDITQKKNDSRRLEFIARATSEVIWERSIDSGWVTFNGTNFQQLFGYEAAGNCIELSFLLEKIHPEDRKELLETQAQALAAGLDFYVHEYRFRKSDDSWAFIKGRTYIVKDHEHKPTGLVGAMEDVTSERLAEKALQESEQRYRQLFNLASLPKAVYDKESLQILEVNDEAVEHYGYSREEFLNMTIMDLRPPADYSRVHEALKKTASSNRMDFGQWTHIKKGGDQILVHVSVATINYKGKQANLATVMDVTEKQRLQEALTREKIRQQKRITRAVIEAQEKERSEIGRELHDNVNQILTTAKLYVENIHYYPEQREVFVEKSTALLQKSINEIRYLSKALVTPTIRDIGIEETLLELINGYRQLNQFFVTYKFDFDPMAIDKKLGLTLYRILQELFTNTVKYAKATVVHTEVRQDGGQLIVQYRDNGVGFDPSARKNGLGISNIKNRASVYKGTVLMNSSEGTGCVVRITFPVGPCSTEMNQILKTSSYGNNDYSHCR